MAEGLRTFYVLNQVPAHTTAQHPNLIAPGHQGVDDCANSVLCPSTCRSFENSCASQDISSRLHPGTKTGTRSGNVSACQWHRISHLFQRLSSEVDSDPIPVGRTRLPHLKHQGTARRGGIVSPSVDDPCKAQGTSNVLLVRIVALSETGPHRPACRSHHEQAFATRPAVWSGSICSSRLAALAAPISGVRCVKSVAAVWRLIRNSQFGVTHATPSDLRYVHTFGVLQQQVLHPGSMRC